MKRIFAFFLVVLLIGGIFAGCSETFDMNKSIAKLKQKGYTVSKEYKTEYQLKEASAIFNAEIKFFGGNFQIEVKYGITLENPKSLGSSCQFVELATQEQAEQYAQHYLKVRNYENEYKVAQSGTVVIITDLKNATDIIPLEFK